MVPSQPEADRIAGRGSSQPEAPRPAVRRAKTAIGLVVTVGVTALVLNRLGIQFDDVSALSWEGWDPRWPWIVASVIVLCGAFVCSAGIWSWIVVDLGGPRLSIWDAGHVVFIGNLGRYVPGKVWQVAGMAWLAAEKGVPPVLATVAAVVGTAVGLLAAIVLGVPGIWRHTTGTAGWIAIGGVLIGVIVLVSPGIFRWGINTALRIGRGGHKLASGNLHGAKWLSLYIVNWVGYASAFALFAGGSGLDISPFVAGTAFAAAYVIGYLAFFAPAGAGVREAGLVALLAGILPPAEALTLAVAGRVWITVVELAIALVFLRGTRRLTGEGKGVNAAI